ncbi:MAG: orotidine-5'-phosphate decarboxylase [Halioglobus sp.]
MSNPVIVALDFSSAEAALALVDRLTPARCRLKVGKELFTRGGPQLVEQLQSRGFEVFLDLKFHDIPNTVAGAVKAAADLGVWMVNVHASGGRRMLEAAREALNGVANPPLLIAVTVLTSLSEEDLHELGYSEMPEQRVLRLARLAEECGLDGVVCSAQESTLLQRELGDEFCLVTPGIRLAGDDAGDQRRVVTPAAAMAAGSHYLVVGRSVTAATDPLAALERIADEVSAA